MMHLQNLTKFLNAFFACHLAVLACPLVAPFRFALLRLPIWAVSFLCRAVDVLRVIFSGAVNISAFSGAVFSYSFMGLQSTQRNNKRLLTVQAGTSFAFSGPCFYSGVLALRRAVFSSAVF